MTNTIYVWKITFGIGMITETYNVVADTIDEALSKARKEYEEQIKDVAECYEISKVEHLETAEQ